MSYKTLSQEDYEKLLSLKNSEQNSIYNVGDREQVAETYKRDVEFLLHVIDRLALRLEELRKVCKVSKMFIGFDVISFKEEINELLSRYDLSNSL